MEGKDGESIYHRPQLSDRQCDNVACMHDYIINHFISLLFTQQGTLLGRVCYRCLTSVKQYKLLAMRVPHITNRYLTLEVEFQIMNSVDVRVVICDCY
jgi:hypothetical protein